jgi:hypothetical protein
MQSLEKPLTERERKKFQELMSSDRLFDEMLERAVRGRRGADRRARKPVRAA